MQVGFSDQFSEINHIPHDENKKESKILTPEEFVANAIFHIKNQKPLKSSCLRSYNADNVQDKNFVRDVIQLIKIKDDSNLEETSHYVFVFKELRKEVPNLREILGYDITSAKTIAEIAKIHAADHFGGFLCYIADYRDYLDQESLVAIAKIAAASSGYYLSRNIQKFGITDKGALVAIAKIAAAHDCGHLSENIKEFGITEQKDLVAIAKIAAARDGCELSKHIDFYGIYDPFNDQESLVAIAKIAAAENGRGTSAFIQQYYIINVKDRVEIAKIAAAQSGHGVTEHLGQFRIKDLKDLVAIAKIAAAQDGKAVSENIKKWGINDSAGRLEILLIAARQNRAALKYIESYQLDEFYQPTLENVGNYLRAGVDQDEIRKFAKHLFPDRKDKDAFPEKMLKIFRVLVGKIDKANSAELRKELYLWLVTTMHLSALKTHVFPEQIQKIWEMIIDYRDPQMRYTFVSTLAQLDEKQVSLYKKITEGKTQDYTLLPAIFLSRLIKEPKKWEQLITLLQSSAFKDVNKYRPLVDTLHALDNATELSEDEVVTLLTLALTDKKKAVSQLWAIKGVLDLQGVQELQQEAFKAHGNDLSKVYGLQFSKQIPIKKRTDFLDRFEETFGKCRDNNALLVYAGVLGKCSDKVEALSTLATYVDSVLDGKYKEERYAGSLHLDKVFEMQKMLKENWIKGATLPLEIKTSHSTKKINYNEYFTLKILTDKHLDIGKFPFLEVYLTKKAESFNGKTITQSIEAAKKELQLSASTDKKKAGLVLKSLQLQAALMGLMHEQMEEEQLKTLGVIYNLLQESVFKCELENDIKELMNAFEKPKSTNALVLADTDDFWDLMLCGTEVSGSCQRVDGLAQDNLGLLGYLLDGKLRLMAIKDKTTGKIIARRIVRVLLHKDQPVMLMEKYYSAGIKNSEHEKALSDFIMQRAKALELPLYQADDGKDAVYLESKSSKSHWEYVDSAGGIRYRGIYKTKAARVEIKDIL